MIAHVWVSSLEEINHDLNYVEIILRFSLLVDAVAVPFEV